MSPDMLDADEVRMLSEIGFVAASTGMRRQAAGVFEALIVLRPQRAFAYIGMATLHLDGGRADDAVRTLEVGRRMVDARTVAASTDAATQWEDDRLSIYVFLGLALDAARRHGQALRTLRTALELAPAGDARPTTILARGLLGLVEGSSRQFGPAWVNQTDVKGKHDGN